MQLEKQQKEKGQNNKKKGQRKPIRNQMLREIYFSLTQPIKDQLINQLHKLGRQYTFTEICVLTSSLIKNLQQEDAQLFKYIGCEALRTIKRLVKYKVPNKFIFCYLQTIEQIFNKIKPFLKNEKLQQYTNTIPYEYLAKFIKFFRLQLTDKQIYTYVQQLLVDSYLTEDAMMLIDLSNNKKQILDSTIKKCLSQDQSTQVYKALGKAARKNGFRAKEYPQLQQKLQIPAVNYYLKLGWEHLQQICLYRPNLLAYGVDMLIKRSNKLNEAASIVLRNKHILEYLRCHRAVKNKIQNPQMKQITNSLQTNYFGPSQNHFLHLRDLGIERQNVFFVNQKTPMKQLDQIVQEILQSKIIAIDTQSVVLRTSLHSELDILSLIQVAVKSKVFVLDAHVVNEIGPLKNAFESFFDQPGNMIVGHALQNDLSVFKDALNIETKSKCQVLQIKTKYPKITDMHKGNPSLAKLCAAEFKKELCKKYTITNWQRRPLLQNQIHYAALDAYAVLQLYHRTLK